MNDEFAIPAVPAFPSVPAFPADAPFGPAEPEHPSPRPPALKLGDIAAEGGLRRIQIVAWRDLDHPEAGGSEMHAARIAERWAEAGIDVTLTASRAPGAPRSDHTGGYRIGRPAGRYLVFPTVGAAGLAERLRPSRTAAAAAPDATVEVWNGMPFFSPLWSAHPRLVFLHHVHGGMWDLVLPAGLAAIGKFVERRLAPDIYRATPVVTLSESSRQAIIESLGMTPQQVTVVPPGVDERFQPGGRPEPHPFVVAVGRLVPYKRFDLLVEVLVRVRERHPDLTAVIAGEGSERPALEALVARHGATDWISLPGRVDDDTLLDLYQRAWLLMSTSAYEGWGLTITEAAACGTPAVVSPIAGHVDAVWPGASGYLAEPGPAMEDGVNAVLDNQIVRRRLRSGALERVRFLTWDRTARQALEVLTADATRPGRPGRPGSPGSPG
jgi:glycosyltransferase involved in cell wall biosynthesis